MTTSDLIAEALIRFREEIMAEVHREIRKAIKPHFVTKPKLETHECVYSKAMNQTYPRLCVKCGVPETPKNKIEIKCAPDCVACARNREIMQDKFPRHTLD